MTLPAVYITQHQIAQVWGQAFRRGLGPDAPLLAPSQYDPTRPAAMYGVLRGTGDIVKRCWKDGNDFVYIDHGYLTSDNPHFHGKVRVCWNSLQTDLKHEPNFARLLSTGIVVRESEPSNRLAPVLVSEPSDHIGQFFGFEPGSWSSRVRQKLEALCPRRTIIVCRKGDGGLARRMLPTAWGLVVLQSNLAVEAVARGIPVFCALEGLDPRAGHPVAALGNTSLAQIEDPVLPDAKTRSCWLAQLAACQFNLAELQTGVAWKFLQQTQPKPKEVL